jgi:DNA-binding transcriptional regulator GbsR (MarR family)
MAALPPSTLAAVEPQALREAQDQFISIWAQMGSTWGIPRTMAEVHALLFVAGRPMNTDEVMQRLRVSRGNASMTLRALVDWGIVTRTHVRGDRKEYFEAEQDVWKLFRTIIRERKKREVDPLLEALRECRLRTDAPPTRKLNPGAAAIEAHNRRLDDMLAFMTTVHRISERFTGPAGKGLQVAAKLLGRAS